MTSTWFSVVQDADSLFIQASPLGLPDESLVEFVVAGLPQRVVDNLTVEFRETEWYSIFE